MDTLLLDYIEKEAKENAAFHLSNADALLKESNTLLNLLLAGAGGALGLMIALAQKIAPTWQLAGVCSVSLYLFAIAGLLLFKCLWVKPIYPPSNEPVNLMQDGFDVLEIRKAELNNKQGCITLNRERNDHVGYWLNRCRAMAACVPLVFLAAAWVVAQ
jgi:hypothetical protein